MNLRTPLIILEMFVVMLALFVIDGVSIGETKPLNDLTFNLNEAASTRPATYDLRSISHKGATEESAKYGSLTTSTKFDKGSIVFQDKLIVTLPDQPANSSAVFDRTIIFPAHNLFVPQKVIIDLSAGGQTVHQFNFENGIAKYIEEDSSQGTEKLDFSDGILTFNALLRLTPLLPRSVDDVYTFKRSDEMFLFRIHTADKSDPIFTFRCDSLETIKIGEQPYDCVKFELEQKSVPNKMYFWVDKTSNVIVKFSVVLPEGADADRVEATLKE